MHLILIEKAEGGVIHERWSKI